MTGFSRSAAALIALLPVFAGASPPEAADRFFEWSYKGKAHRFAFHVPNFRSCQEAIKDFPHDWEEPVRYLSNYPCEESLVWIAGELRDVGRDLGYGRADFANFLLNFVRSIPYAYDKDSTGRPDYTRYPYETLLDRTGDCEDFALLYSAILSHWCFDVVLLNTPGHVAVGINTKTWNENASGTYYDFNDGKYYYCEATGCRNGRCDVTRIGETPEIENAAENQYEARIIDVPRICTFPSP
ncbi:MAG TPA: transglutaminase-like domain-containing protein [Bdellovibrionota bacterium]|nr:transglutaminase-like domain-containing protein [Bdellovibrionota bacterium]